MPSSRTAVTLFALALAGCGQEINLVTLTPELSVLPTPLDFGEVVADEASGTLEVFVDNGGRADLVGTVSLEGTDAAQFSLEAGVGDLALEPGDGLSFLLTFTPTAVAPAEAALVFETNDGDEPTLAVPVTGLGRVPYAPDIEVSPTSLPFETVAPGDDRTLFFDVKNVGDADLHLGTLTQSGAGVFALDTDYSGATLAPGQTRSLLVTYAPVTGSGDSGTLVIPSDDPDEPEVEVALEGNGGGTADYPEARIDCPGTVDLAGPVSVTLDGTRSSDPNDLDLTYTWGIVRRPAAADASRQPTPTDQPTTEVLLDAAGLWEVQLQVVNALGVPSTPTKCVIDAVPVDQLHVELSWSGATSDLDLHLAEDDAPFYSVPGDVSWCNRNPNWGAPGSATDDPSLDLDDDRGFGPENINVREPADGAYPVRVHLFDDGDDGDVTATVSVFTSGQLVHTSSKVLRRNEVWEVGQVNWPEGSFGVSNERPWDAGGTRECP
jgi:hypothetical protein